MSKAPIKAPTSISSAGASLRRCHVGGSEDGERGRLLIVGATGVLRPAVQESVALGLTVVAVARNVDRLDGLAGELGAGVRPVSLDVYDAAAMSAALTSGVLSAQSAIVYLASDDDTAENAAVDGLSAAVSGRTVRILTSRWIPPEGPDVSTGRWPTAAGRAHLLLGVASTGDGGRTRWHTPEEISAAALGVLSTGRDAVLGKPPA